MSEKWTGLLGIVVILGLAVLLSSDRRAIRLRVVGAAFVTQLGMAALILYVPAGRRALDGFSSGVLHVIGYAKEGSRLMFGSLMDANKFGFVFAFNVLPIIVFFSALMSVLYHLGVMQLVVKFLGGTLRKVIGTATVESLNAAANVFVGQTEAPLVVKPYLKNQTDAQMFAIMTSGLASVAGTVLAAYVLMGAELKYLIAASFMSAPGGLLMAKIILPDAEASSGDDGGAETLGMEDSKHENVLLAAAMGAGHGLQLAINIGAMLVAFVALIALLNGILGGLSGWLGHETSLEAVLGWVFSPLMRTLGIPWSEASAAGALFGEKVILNEFVAFSHMGQTLAGMSDRTHAIVTFALCGFANLSSVAILLGGLGELVPEKRPLIARLGLRAVAAGSLSNLMSAALAGLLLPF